MVPDEDGVAICLEPEYQTMSRRPGIGQAWFEGHKGDCYPKDFVTHNSFKFKIPSYYDAIYDNEDPDLIRQLRLKRKVKACKNPKENSIQRLKEKERVLNKRIKLLTRGIE